MLYDISDKHLAILLLRIAMISVECWNTEMRIEPDASTAYDSMLKIENVKVL